MYLSLNDINRVQLDHTSRCNLACPQCARTENNWSHQDSNKGLDLSIEDYRIIFEPLKEGIEIVHCGNYGDVIASPTFNETFSYTLSKKPKNIHIATNGSIRPKEWWRDLAIEGNERLTIDFAIDGLEDTHSVYRVNSKWQHMMSNIHEFIKAGGHANWNYLVFEHNQHQLEKAYQMAKDMGFKKFNVKTTARFLEKKQGTLKENAENIAREQYKEIVKKQTFEEYTNTTKISCKFRNEKAIFIDMNMNLLPCCWFGSLNQYEKPNEGTKVFQSMHEKYGEDFLNMRVHGWDVLNNILFSDYLEKSWSHPEQYKRVSVCGKVCGEKFEHSSGYGQNIKKHDTNNQLV